MEQIEESTISIDILRVISFEQAWQYFVIPFESDGTMHSFYYSKLKDRATIKNELELLLGFSVRLLPKEDKYIQQLLAKYYRKPNVVNNEEQHLSVRDVFSEDILTKFILESKNLGGSDIHLEIYNNKCRIRIRVDGKLIERYSFKHEEYPSLVNKIKIRANLDISEKRLPQDGRIYFEHKNYKFDLRVSILPTLFGEKIVLRLLNNSSNPLSLENIGFSEQELPIFRNAIQKPNGIVLISGPTGSGKTTTLYASLRLLNQEGVNILTIEDPIEYTLEGINQVQLKEDIGLTFAEALRTFLRQDPDIIMLGEIRDSETATMAIRASLTGHLVLSTIHTNSAWGTISRLMDMGVPSYLIANTLNISVAQRLIRILCVHCKEPVNLKDYKLSGIDLNENARYRTYKAKGCEKCHYTGYAGRQALYEIIPISNTIRELIKSNYYATPEFYKQNGICTLSERAVKLFLNGSTAFEEIFPILGNIN